MHELKMRAANQLSELIAYFHMMYDESMENVAAYDLDGRMVYINPTLKKTLELNSPEDHEKLRGAQAAPFHSIFNAIHHVIETGEPTQLFLSAPNSFASRAIHDQIYVSPIRDKQGNIIAVTTIGRDMNYAEAERLSEEKQHATYLRALLDNFPFMVWMKDKDSHFLEVNQKFAEVVNEPKPKYLLGKTDFDYFPQDMAQGYVDDDKEVLRTGLVNHVEKEIQKADGTVYWAEAYKSPVEIDGEIIGTVGFARDITERKRLIAEINEKSAAYQSLIEHLPMSVIRYDTDCRRVFIKDKYIQQHLGALYFEEKLTPEEQWHPNIINLTGAEFVAQLREVMKTGNPRDIEIKTQVGNAIHVAMTKLVPEFNASKQITGALAIIQDVTQTHDYRKKIEHLAYYDSITGLPNRSHFQEQLQNQLDLAKRNGSSLCVMMLDLDHFKSINDELGHSVGDHMLAEVALRLKDTTTGKALLARLGGDEFAVLMSNYASSNDINDLAHEILSVMTPAFSIEGRDIFLSASIGVATYPDHADTPQDLMKYADTAMYLAKKQGRNTHQFFYAGINETTHFNHALRTELRHAIEREEFFVVYQPIYDIQQNCIVKYEALVRWQSPTLGLVGPDKFIPVAEEYGLINEIGNWVMLKVCRDAVTVNQQSAQRIRFAINLSPRQFIRNNLLETIRFCLSSSKCPENLIEFEITEGLLMEKSAEVTNTLALLQQQGFAISIDDFGTGYSSLSYLSNFPISTVKIDKSFVQNIINDEKNATLTKAIINLTVSLGKTLTAEGIETQEQLALLQSWGCHFGQGYLLGKPQLLQQVLATQPAKAH